MSFQKTRHTRVLVTGATGQVGSFIADCLIDKGYEVHTIIRRKASENNYENIKHNIDKIKIHEGDITDYVFMTKLLKKYQFDYVYNMAAMSFVKYSFENPVDTFRVDAEAVINMLYVLENYSPKTRYYQSSTSEMFGNAPAPQNEDTPFLPASPYGISKLAAHHAVRLVRERGLFAVAGIMFNTESERRGKEFVTRKITSNIARIKLGLQDKIILGSLTPKRDWSYAGDSAEAIIWMLERDVPEDFVIGTGVTRSIYDFVKAAKEAAGIDKSVEDLVEQDEQFMRPNEVYELHADPTKLYKKMKKTRRKFEGWVKTMVQNDIRLEAQKNDIPIYLS